MKPARCALVVATALLLACGGGVGGAGAGLPPGAGDPEGLFFAPELAVNLADMERTRSGLYIQDLEEGRGPVAMRESLVSLRYVGWLPDGTVVDASVGGDPYQVRLGGNEVIRGWNEGIRGMRLGGTRRLVIRPSLGYGGRGSTRVPPNSTLVFLVELVDVR